MIILSYHNDIFLRSKKPTIPWEELMAKNTHTFQNEIKHYNKIRNILRYLYLYDISSLDEFLEKKLINSTSSLYNTCLRIKNYINSEYLQEPKVIETASGKKFHLIYDPFRCPVNYLAETYQNCSYVIDDIIFYFCLMQTFIDADDKNPYEHFDYKLPADKIDSVEFNGNISVADLFTIISNIYNSNLTILKKSNQLLPDFKYNDKLFTPPQIRARLTELTDIGILIKTNSSKEIRYHLSSDIFLNLTADELYDLQLMTQFFYNSTFLTIPGFYLSSTLEAYSNSIFLKEKVNFFYKQKNPVFFYKNHRLQTVIDDDVTWTILTAIHKKEVLQYSYKTQDSEELLFHSLPIKLVIDKQYGRQYFFGYSYDEKNFFMAKISSIIDIQIDKKFNVTRKYECFELEQSDETPDTLDSLYTQTYKEQTKNIWNVALNDTTSIVTIHFSFPTENYKKWSNYLISTKRHGTITKLENGQIDFTVEVQDECELIPWIRSFGAYAVVDSETNPFLAQKLKFDWKEALKQYETI